MQLVVFVVEIVVVKVVAFVVVVMMMMVVHVVAGGRGGALGPSVWALFVGGTVFGELVRVAQLQLIQSEQSSN